MKRKMTVSALVLACSAMLPLSAAADPAREMASQINLEELAEQLPEFERPQLWIGDPAPELEIGKVFKGEHSGGLQRGTVYVVETWATWCGPCIAAFPHLTKLQEEFKGDVKVLGVNIWDNKSESEIAEFVENQGDRMGYTVVKERGTSVADNWMRPAGRTGIPAAFIVDREGRIAWMGHPMRMDEPLKRVVKPDFSATAEAERAKRDHKANAWISMIWEHITAGDDEKANRGYALGYALLEADLKDQPESLNRIAWAVLTGRGVHQRNADFAIAAATRACELTEWRNASIIDTLARAYYEKGDNAKAAELQQKAVDAASDEAEKDDYRKVLDYYRQQQASASGG